MTSVARRSICSTSSESRWSWMSSAPASATSRRPVMQAGGAIDGDGAQTRHSVDALERSVDAFMGAGSVVVDADVDAFGNLEGGGVLFGFRQRRTKHVDLLSELRG